MRIKIVALNARFTHSSLALFHVRNEVEKNCPEVETELCQLTINDAYYETLLRLSTGCPDYIFFSVAVWSSDRVEQLIRDLPRCLPGCRVVVGGPQAVVIGRSLGPLCTVVSGDIEAVGSEFYQDLRDGALRSGYGRSFFQMPDRVLLSPYREEDFATHLQNRAIYYESSRGCPFSCTYCLSSVESGVYHKDLAQVRLELCQILAHRPATLRFVDRTFNDRPERALAIWEFLLSMEAETLFHFEISPDRFTQEQFTFLQSVPPGRFQFEIGLQSTCGETLDAVNRKMDVSSALANIKRLAGMGSIHLHVDLILGLPFETRESFARSFADLFATGAHYMQMGLLKLLPDTEISKNADRAGYISCRQPPYAVLANQWLDHGAMRDLYWLCECVEKFVNNRYFPSLWAYLRRTDEDIFLFFQGLQQLCRQENFFGLAATQEFMGQLLCRLFSLRQDGSLLVELLRYDWLRCGHRYLPRYLQKDGEGEHLQSARNQLYELITSGAIEGWGGERRDQWFKKGVCMRFSAGALRELNLSPVERQAIVIFLPEREESLFRLQKTTVVTIPA